MTYLKVRVLIKHTPIRPHMRRLIPLLLTDRRNTTRTKSGAARPDELRQPSYQLELGLLAGDLQLRVEFIVRLLQVFKGIVLDI